VLDAVILSDIHLGSRNCQARRLCDFLEQIVDGEVVTKRLILNGDVFDSFDFRRLNKHHWKVLSLIRKLSDRLDVTWIAGNHDGSAEIVSHLLGLKIKDEDVIDSGGRRILAMHGHQFDDFIDAHPILTWLGDCIYAVLQRLDRTHTFAKLAKKGSKTFLRCVEKIEEGAIGHARKKGCAAVCCGHTHHAISRPDQSIAYHNSGCWTELPCSYLTVRNGEVELRHLETVLAEDAPAAEMAAVS
jgi:UDP-2,3-diacylglucosamine pyrophosphatase LpxH